MKDEKEKRKAGEMAQVSPDHLGMRQHAIAA
jgi:hypothetical protein